MGQLTDLTNELVKNGYTLAQAQRLARSELGIPDLSSNNTEDETKIEDGLTNTKIDPEDGSKWEDLYELSTLVDNPERNTRIDRPTVPEPSLADLDVVSAAAPKSAVDFTGPEYATIEKAALGEAAGAGAAAIAPEMPMLGAMLGGGSSGGMMGGAAGAALGGSLGGVAGSTIMNYASDAAKHAFNQGSGETDVSQFMPGNTGGSGAPSASASDSTADPIAIFKSMKGYLRTIASNTAKSGGRGTDRM